MSKGIPPGGIVLILFSAALVALKSSFSVSEPEKVINFVVIPMVLGGFAILSWAAVLVYRKGFDEAIAWLTTPPKENRSSS